MLTKVVYSAHWIRLACALASGAAVFGSAGALRADDDDRCRFVDGPFSSDLVDPPVCKSPVGLCTHGQLEGDFPAIYDFTFSTLESAGDPTDPTEFVYTGHSTVTTPQGVLSTDDSGVIHISDPAAPPMSTPSPFVTTPSVASGTGRYVGATGAFVATGTLTFATGHATGRFIGQVCRAERW